MPDDSKISTEVVISENIQLKLKDQLYLSFARIMQNFILPGRTLSDRKKREYIAEMSIQLMVKIAEKVSGGGTRFISVTESDELLDLYKLLAQVEHKTALAELLSQAERGEDGTVKITAEAYDKLLSLSA